MKLWRYYEEIFGKILDWKRSERAANLELIEISKKYRNTDFWRFKITDLVLSDS